MDLDLRDCLGRVNKTHIIVKFHRIDLVICSHFLGGGGGTSSYSQIHTLQHAYYVSTTAYSHNHHIFRGLTRIFKTGVPRTLFAKIRNPTM